MATNLSANKFDNYKSSQQNIRKSFVVNSGSTIYRGALVMVNAAGYLVPAANTASCHLAGVALDKVVGDGTLECEVDIGGALILVTNDDGSQAQADVGDGQWATGDASTQDASANVKAGLIAEIASATSVWVRLLPFGTQS